MRSGQNMRFHAGHVVRRMFAPVLMPLADPKRIGWLRFVPTVPRRRRLGEEHVWQPDVIRVGDSLKTTPGIWRDPAAEQRAFEENPLRSFNIVQARAVRWALRHAWSYLVPMGPRFIRSMYRLDRVSASAGKLPANADADKEALTDAVRAEARRLGFSTVGFAPYDEKYIFRDAVPGTERGSVVVCVFEQDFDATQSAPSHRAETAAVEAYTQLMQRMAKLATFLQERGVRARPHGVDGPGVVIHFAVEAGLGQLGLNGQLLTPEAGSRARIGMITTDAKLVEGRPVDYGINAICDQCKLCVRRCPVGAIPSSRKTHRGVTKAKIKLDRCLPVMGQTDGCAICMKVCPVQRFGLKAVVGHHESTGAILGKGTDDLEGYQWPIDGRRYGSGQKPRIDSKRLLRPPDLHIEPPQQGPSTSERTEGR